jgi:hypothetical protein
MNFSTLIKKPSAYLPIVMSLTALTLVLVCLATFGIIHETDEGIAAHIWQLLMGAQAPIVVFFAIRWLPQAPRQVLCILALQAGAAFVSFAPVFFFNL